MKVAVVGAGGVGGYFGARLQASGVEVGFLARGAHLEAIRTDGLRITSPLGDVHLQNVMASDRPEDLGAFDVVLVAVKTWQLDAVLDAVAALTAEEGVVVPLLNGVEAADRIATRVGEDRVLGGTCKILSQVASPGHVAHLGSTPWVSFGERGSVPAAPSARADALHRLFRSAEVAARVADDIEAVVWDKLLFVASLGAVGAASRAPVGVVRTVPRTRALLRAAMGEVEQVAESCGVRLSSDAVDRAMRFVDGLPEAATSSLQRDIIEGRQSELEAWSGAVVRLAEASDIAVPVHAHLYASLLPQALKAQRLVNF
ncbi:MAG: 2-dehydropantoate 2-reductase [Myxococcota bacterium]